MLPTKKWYSNLVRLILGFCVAWLLTSQFASAQTIKVPCLSVNGGAFQFNDSHPYLCMITITNNADRSQDVRIDQPVVNAASFTYPSVELAESDLVTVTADGCVQTAGSGSTWKRYVNPSGSNSGPPGGYYYGTIFIKGGITSKGPLNADGTPIQFLTPLTEHQPAQIFIEPLEGLPAQAPRFLTLGYVDDNYSDHGGNGYWGHDNGNNDQCANTSLNAPSGQFGGPAFVKLHIVHHAANPLASVPPKEWDLVSPSLDANGILLNPEWGWQVTGGQIGKDGSFDPTCLPGCTSQQPEMDTFDISTTTFKMKVAAEFGDLCNYHEGTNNGHLNWDEATYHGQVFWVTHDGGENGDDDYNMRLATPVFHADPAGTTLGNTQNGDEINIGMEFDSDETIDNFDQSPFWSAFHSMVDNQGDDATGAAINGHDAVVIALMGFDEVHAQYTELHPVHVLAVRESPPGARNLGNDRWFFFARNWGDEGGCSHLQHNLLANELTIQLPDPLGGLTGLKATMHPNPAAFGDDSRLDFFSSSSEGTFVTFHLPDPSAQGLDFGEFELSWESDHVDARPNVPHVTNANYHLPLSSAAAQPLAAEIAPTREANMPEGRLAAIWEKTSPSQRRLYADLLQSIYPARQRPVRPAMELRVQPGKPKFSKKPPAHQVVEATEKLHRDGAHAYAWCAATEGRLPTQPDWCKDFPPLTVLSTDSSTGKVMLSAHDAGGAGIDTIEYSLDGKTWARYTGPFTKPQGVSSVLYRTRDKSGKVEAARRTKL